MIKIPAFSLEYYDKKVIEHIMDKYAMSQMDASRAFLTSETHAMLENPEILQRLIQETGAKSTDLEAPEPVEHLCGKCVEYAENWKPMAERIWEDDHPQTPGAGEE